MVQFTRQMVQIDTGSPDAEGCVLLADGRLIAVLVRLDDMHGPDLSGKWFLEHGFGALDQPDHPVFDDLDAAEDWISSRLAAASLASASLSSAALGHHGGAGGGGGDDASQDLQ